MTHSANIYCVSHKPVTLEGTGITSIQVGDLPTQCCDLRDNTDDNIASQNGILSELTAHYWIWKNQRSDIVGLCHYRRFLLPEELTTWLEQSATKPYADLTPGGVGNYASGYVIDSSMMLEKLRSLDYPGAMCAALDDADILLPAPNKLPDGGFLEQYGRAHPVEPLFAMLAAIAAKNNNLAKAAHQFFTTHRQAYWNNLYITRRDVFEEYCEFQFDTLLPLLEVPRTFDDAYQHRYGAFLSERLFNFWLWHRKLKVKHLPWCMTETMEEGVDPHQRKIKKKNRTNI